VLRHVHGHERFSRDIDATRINPPKHKLDAAAVAATIRGSGTRNLVRLNPGTPETDSGRSLDFDRTGPAGRGIVSVEISYREDVIEAPDLAAVGEPYYDPFVIPVMTINEIVAEKLRALAQRLRPTDLADVAMVLRDNEIDAARVRVLAATKFELVSSGNQRTRPLLKRPRKSGPFSLGVPGWGEARVPNPAPISEWPDAVPSRMRAWRGQPSCTSRSVFEPPDLV
jgi:hypothetical protein